MRGASVLLGVAAAAVACKVPNTLGLPCNEDEHCDAGQYCGEGKCLEGSAPSPGTTSEGETTDPTIVDPVTSSTGTPTVTTLTAPTSLSSGSSDTDPSTSSSTGPTCGEAAGTCDHLDVLFVIDNSASMEEDFNVLLPAFTDFDALAAAFVDGLCSYHIGITTTAAAPDYQPEECQMRGALNRSGALAGADGCFPDDPTHPPYLTEEDPLQRLGCLLTVGNRYEDDERQIDTVLAAVGPDLAAPGACNEGFVREDGALLVVIVTDEDDDDDSEEAGEEPYREGSSGNPSAWFEALTDIKPASNLGVVLIAGTQLGGCDWSPALGSEDGAGAEYPDRLLTFLQYFSGSGYIDHIESSNLCGTAAELMADVEEFHGVVNAVCSDAVFE